MTQDEVARAMVGDASRGYTQVELCEKYRQFYQGGRDDPTPGWACGMLRRGRTLADDAESAQPGGGCDPVPDERPVKHLQLSHRKGGLVVSEPLENPAPRVFLRAAVFDVETTDFSATGYDGFLVCCSVFPLDAEEPYTLALEFDDLDDERLVRAAVADLSRYDILIGHYVLGFDLPWVSTRADHHHLPPLRRWLVYDTYYAARAQNLKTDRKSLAFLVDHFGIEGTKTAIYPRHWNNIRSRKPAEFEAARRAICEHCELDVIANRNLFDRLMPGSWALAANPFKVTRWAGKPDYAAYEEAA